MDAIDLTCILSLCDVLHLVPLLDNQERNVGCDWLTCGTKKGTSAWNQRQIPTYFQCMEGRVFLSWPKDGGWSKETAAAVLLGLRKNESISCMSLHIYTWAIYHLPCINIYIYIHIIWLCHTMTKRQIHWTYWLEQFGQNGRRMIPNMRDKGLKWRLFHALTLNIAKTEARMSPDESRSLEQK